MAAGDSVAAGWWRAEFDALMGGRVENAQVGVFMAYACARGRALIDRRLYVPKKSWLADPGRCRAAGVPEDVTFATKPAPAAQMIISALAAGVPAAWVSGDEVYGQDPHLRAVLEDHQIGYVLAVARQPQGQVQRRRRAGN